VFDEELTPFDPKAPNRLRIGTCNQYLQWVVENAEQWTAGRQKNGADLILISIFARSARTYEGMVRCLGEKGFGEQGLMLNRSLFEDMIDAHWLSINCNLATDRLYKHDTYSRLLRAERNASTPRCSTVENHPRSRSRTRNGRKCESSSANRARVAGRGPRHWWQPSHDCGHCRLRRARSHRLAPQLQLPRRTCRFRPARERAPTLRFAAERPRRSARAVPRDRPGAVYLPQVAWFHPVG